MIVTITPGGVSFPVTLNVIWGWGENFWPLTRQIGPYLIT